MISHDIDVRFLSCILWCCWQFPSGFHMTICLQKSSWHLVATWKPTPKMTWFSPFRKKNCEILQLLFGIGYSLSIRCCLVIFGCFTGYHPSWMFLGMTCPGTSHCRSHAKGDPRRCPLAALPWPACEGIRCLDQQLIMCFSMFSLQYLGCLDALLINEDPNKQHINILIFHIASFRILQPVTTKHLTKLYPTKYLIA